MKTPADNFSGINYDNNNDDNWSIDCLRKFIQAWSNDEEKNEKKKANLRKIVGFFSSIFFSRSRGQLRVTDNTCRWATCCWK